VVVSTELLSRFTGFASTSEGLVEMRRLGEGFRRLGLDVIREKLEVDPSSIYPSHIPFAELPGYLEAHFRVTHAPGARASVLALRDDLVELGLRTYASYNTLKRTVAPGTEVTLLTLRSFTTDLPEFTQNSARVFELLSKFFPTTTPVTEWAVSDSNVELDRLWIPAPTLVGEVSHLQ
jgi:hypothetical protein